MVELILGRLHIQVKLETIDQLDFGWHHLPIVYQFATPQGFQKSQGGWRQRMVSPKSHEELMDITDS